MRIERSFPLASTPGAVWDALADSRSMAECLPGAEIDDGTDGGCLEGRLRVRLGPIRAVFEGTVTVTRDETRRGGTMHAEGRDKRTGTRVRAVIEYTLTATEAGSAIALSCDLSLSGTLAQFARQTLIDRLAGELVEGFSTNFEKHLLKGEQG